MKLQELTRRLAFYCAGISLVTNGIVRIVCGVVFVVDAHDGRLDSATTMLGGGGKVFNLIVNLESTIRRLDDAFVVFGDKWHLFQNGSEAR